MTVLETSPLFLVVSEHVLVGICRMFQMVIGSASHVVVVHVDNSF